MITGLPEKREVQQGKFRPSPHEPGDRLLLRVIEDKGGGAFHFSWWASISPGGRAFFAYDRPARLIAASRRTSAAPRSAIFLIFWVNSRVGSSSRSWRRSSSALPLREVKTLLSW